MAETLTAFFSYTAVGLSASFRDLSYGNPSSWDWDFGDGSSNSTDQHPTHLFTEEGFHTVTLTISDEADPPVTVQSTQRVGVSSSPEECPQMPTYDAVMLRIPENFTSIVTPPLTYSLIRKWQRIISTLVTPSINPLYTHNELYWPLLANELVIELVVLDIFESKVKNFLMSLASSSMSSSSGTTSSKGSLKSIVTGPSEVQWYDNAQTVSDQLSAVTKTGGFIDQSKNQACSLAAILKVPLFICPEGNKPVFPPKIAKK
jgi:PKD repeat protein